ncbi:TM0106 family RecB-like putative nuclease [Leptolyngbyaceae cyanobacterium CCMR0082]|uniref:TM0106 family RecB-like putative nuclease n=1 Tax=Adonisia turfae CCMR0082 TaxID=2304604 RepID=A0A6M0RZV0_9CYAN|nr:TM0106 family RecB-like putative nuclease [Adonisia turfae]NEZ61242.1 TM0106 family RecB-like putative nuclease [Adonisia turfae CCMR0082]
MPPSQDAGSATPASTLQWTSTASSWSLEQTKPDQIIQDSTLFTFLRCQRRAYLDAYGDADLQSEPSDYLVKLKSDSAVHRQTVLADFHPVNRPPRHAGNVAATAQETFTLMQQGVEHIFRGTVAAINADGSIGYVSQPDLWIKQPGVSWLGNWYYVPLDIKLGKKPKQEYQLTAAFHAYVLAAWQGVVPAEAHLRLKERHYVIDLEKQWPTLLELLDTCETVLTSGETPDVFISRSRCDMCVWLNHCYEVAQQQNHLSLLPGVTLNRYRHLEKLGLTTVETLARNQPATLAQASGFELKVAEKLVHQAQAKLSGAAIARTDANNNFTLSPQELPSAPIELYFDIEAAPDKDLVYLHGILVVDTQTHNETFIPLVAREPEGEASAWHQFQHVIAHYPDSPIYHFCPYEAQTVRRLAERYGSIIDIDELLSRFVDIHKRIVDSVTLPIESYALKHIARWIGFEWRDSSANGAQSICWYDNWLSSQNEQYLNDILKYNEDDCRATFWVKQWLANFAAPIWKDNAEAG